MRRGINMTQPSKARSFLRHKAWGLHTLENTSQQIEIQAVDLHQKEHSHTMPPAEMPMEWEQNQWVHDT